MIPWNQAPLVRLLIPFIAGIIIAIFFPFQFEQGIYIVYSLVLVISSIVLIPKLNISFRRSWWFGTLVNTTFVLLGFQLTILKTEKFSATHFSKVMKPSALVYARIAESPLEKTRSLKVVIDILATQQNGEWKNTCGKAMVYFPKDNRSLGLTYGDEVLVKADLKEVSPPQNPGEFDYKQFLSFHNIYHQAIIKNNNWLYSGNNSGNNIQSAALHFRNSLLNVLKENEVKGNEYAVGSALLIGYEDKLDADIISAYSSTGALHILSVSGLHVAIVYFIFNWLLFFLDKVKYGNVIKAMLLLILLWSYALLTGLSPSVLRAATMFSFIVIAKAFNRHTNIYNTLAASAFLLLLVDPFLLMDVGFQLSYIAVIGIVYIQPKIHQWLEPSTWIMEQVWTITSVSIAAQIATFPLAIYYFHQFPNYFLLSNLIVIPVSTAVIYLGIATLLFSKIALVATWLAMGFNGSVWFLNQTVFEMEKWPYALINGISISLFETILLYGLIILLFAYFVKLRYSFLFISLCLLIFMMGLQLKEQYHQNHQKKIIVYNIPKTSAIDFISERQSMLVADSTLTNDIRTISYRLKNNWANLGIDQTEIVSKDIKTGNLFIKNDLLQFYDKRIAIINEDHILPISSNPLEVDVLIISKNKKINIAEILDRYHTKMVLFDSSNPEYRIHKWKAECDALDQPYYSVTESGAFVLEL